MNMCTICIKPKDNTKHCKGKGKTKCLSVKHKNKQVPPITLLTLTKGFS